MRLVLFDVDGTLVWPDGVGRASITAALEKVYGTRGSVDSYNFAGNTDRQIVKDVLAGEGIPQEVIDARFDAVCRVMAEELVQILPRYDVRPCDGGLELIRRLDAREDVLVGLVTGNFEETAFVKLGAAGYDGDMFKVGAYGSEAADRAHLPPLAARRAEALTGRRFDGETIVVVGDTPADIACARSVSARTVAVATGWTPPEKLRAHSPDELLLSLADTDLALNAILG